MPGAIPTVEKTRILNNFVRNDISLRLYSNDYTPLVTSSVASFTSVAGGGYAAKTLDNALWVVVDDEAEYPAQTFEFTGATTAPSTIYGYYLVDVVTGLLVGAERFPGAVTPFTPVEGSSITFTPLVLAG